MRVRVLASLFAAGATLVLLTLALPHAADAVEPGLLAVALNAYAVAGVLFRLAPATAAPALPLTLGVGQHARDRGRLVLGERAEPARLLLPVDLPLLRLLLHARGRRSRRSSTSGVVYGALLALSPPPSGAVAWWIVGMATMLVAAIVIRVMRDARRAADRAPVRRRAHRPAHAAAEPPRLPRAARPRARARAARRHADDRAGRRPRPLQGGQRPLGPPRRRRRAAARRARCCARACARSTSAARIGGEEFALVLPDTDAHGAFAVAERLRCALRDAFADATVPITISFGIASYPAHGGDGRLAAARRRRGALRARRRAAATAA